MISDPSRGQLEVSSRSRPRRRQAAPGRPWLLSISDLTPPLVLPSPLPREAESSRPCSRQPQAWMQASRRPPRIRLLVAPRHLRRRRAAVRDWPRELQHGPSTHPRSFGRRMHPLGGWSHVRPSRYPCGPHHSGPCISSLATYLKPRDAMVGATRSRRFANVPRMRKERFGWPRRRWFTRNRKWW